MNFEVALITKAIQVGQLDKLILQGIREEHFAVDSCRQIYAFAVAHMNTYRAPPSFEVVKSKFPEFVWEPGTDPIEYLRDELINDVGYRIAVDRLRDLSSLVDSNPGTSTAVAALFHAAGDEIDRLTPGGGLRRFSDMRSRIDEHRARGQVTAVGIPFGIPELDNATFGMQPHELVTISGWSGTGKSALGQLICFNAWSKGHSPLFISLEMTTDEVCHRWDSMATQIRHRGIRGGGLTADEMRQWEEMAERAEKFRPERDMIVIDNLDECTPSLIQAQIGRHKPSFAVIDYLGLMKLPGSNHMKRYERVTELSHQMKRMCMNVRIPIVQIAQSNREAAKSGAANDNIADSMAIMQDSDIMLGLFRNDQMKAENKMQVRLMKNRGGAEFRFDLQWDMENMTFGPWDDSLIFRAKLIQASVDDGDPVPFEAEYDPGGSLDPLFQELEDLLNLGD